MKQLNSHQFEEVYKDLKINLDDLGCIMLDLEPLNIDHWIGQDGVSSYTLGFPFYYARNKTRFWIDGWVAGKVPHITLLYGLLDQARIDFESNIEKVLEGWKLEEVEIEDFRVFDSPYGDEPYYCVVAHIKKTDELLEGHNRLEFLPHINTFTGYKPHMTIAYIEKSAEIAKDNLVADLKREFIGKKLKVKSLNFGGNK